MTAVLTDVTTQRVVSVRPAPRREPPFDDELAADQIGRHLHLATSFEQPLPFDSMLPRRRPRRDPAAASLVVDRFGLPEPQRVARRLLIALLEARAGHRSLAQLAAYFTPSVHAGLVANFARADAGASPSADRQLTLWSVRVSEPVPGVAEVSAVVCAGDRYRAIAARLEGRDGRWQCVRLLFG